MKTPDELLTPHIWLSELCFSQTATRLGLVNEPIGPQLENLRRLAYLLEEVRKACGGAPILISSGLRSPAVNRAVGGASNSAHLDGRAADFIAPNLGSPKQICQRVIDAGIVFDQLIYEQTWVHIGVAPPRLTPRRELLSAMFREGHPTTYVQGIG